MTFRMKFLTASLYCIESRATHSRHTLSAWRDAQKHGRGLCHHWLPFRSATSASDAICRGASATSATEAPHNRLSWCDSRPGAVHADSASEMVAEALKWVAREKAPEPVADHTVADSAPSCSQVNRI
jgi:hypothetical protein